MINNDEFLTIKQLEITKTSTNIVKLTYMDWEKIAISNPIQEFSLKFKEKTIKIDDDYVEENIIDEFINKVFNICDVNSYINKLKEHNIDNINNTNEIRKLMSKIIMCGSYIATNGRIGPAHFILMPYKYFNILSQFINNTKLGGMTVIPTNKLTDKIILGRKNQIDQPGIFLLHDKNENKYKLVDIGTAKNQYHVLKVKFIKDERRKKIEKINKKNVTL